MGAGEQRDTLAVFRHSPKTMTLDDTALRTRRRACFINRFWVHGFTACGETSPTQEKSKGTTLVVPLRRRK
jgi:hypothetical protein